MTVWCVFEADWEGIYLQDIFATRALAESYMQKLGRDRGISGLYIEAQLVRDDDDLEVPY